MPRSKDGHQRSITGCKRLPRPEVNFSAPPNAATAANLHFFFLLPAQGEGCVMFTDPLCSSTIYDIDMESVLVMPQAKFSKPSDSISLSMTAQRVGDDRLHREDEYSLYVMSSTDRCSGFELFNYCRTGVRAYPPVHSKWYWRALPCLPPRLGDRTTAVSAAAVIDDTTICASSTDGSTYAFDVVRRLWRQAGRWVLPFHGAAEYVPELGLWFGLEVGVGNPRHRLCAFDLSSVG